MSETGRIAIIAALPREVAPLVAGWPRAAPQRKGDRIFLAASDKAIVACAGMGQARATLALEAAQSVGPISAIVSVGFAGALAAAAHLGQVYRPSTVIDVRTGNATPVLRETVRSQSPRRKSRRRKRRPGSPSLILPSWSRWKRPHWAGSQQLARYHFSASNLSLTTPRIACQYSTISQRWMDNFAH